MVKFQTLSACEAGTHEPEKPPVAGFSSKWRRQSERTMKKISRQRYRDKQRWGGEGGNKQGRGRNGKTDFQHSMLFIWVPGAKASQVLSRDPINTVALLDSVTYSICRILVWHSSIS